LMAALEIYLKENMVYEIALARKGYDENILCSVDKRQFLI